MITIQDYLSQFMRKVVFFDCFNFGGCKTYSDVFSSQIKQVLFNVGFDPFIEKITEFPPETILACTTFRCPINGLKKCLTSQNDFTGPKLKTKNHFISLNHSKSQCDYLRQGTNSWLKCRGPAHGPAHGSS